MKASRTGRLGLLVSMIVALLVVSLPGSAAAKDRNHDRIPDRWEKKHKLSLKKNQRRLDQDRDGLRNRGEWLAKTNPRDRDSDDDGIPDGKENAGFVVSYDAGSGALTIRLYAGGEISGSVTDRTEIECEGESDEGHHGATASGSGRTGHEGEGESSSEDEAEDENESEDHESEDHESEDHESEDHDGSGGSCSAADLAEGVVIHEAEVRLTSAGVIFRELEIEKPPASG